ncbi:MAG TPA: J domain-containing protein [Acidimicrobiia bacterium]|nr:J domain-containing protein [Acidimicrobiia bacterium]
MLLAELVVRHTRRHMPTRRVAVGSSYLPMTGPAHGAALLGAVVAEHRHALDDDQLDALARLLDDARDGIDIPRIALRYRLQTDVHGLDRSRHRIVGEDGVLVVELDVHGAPVPQIIGAVMAAAALPRAQRVEALRVIGRASRRHGFALAAGVTVRRVAGDHVVVPAASGIPWQPGAPAEETPWVGVAPEERWAKEVLGLRAGTEVERDDVNRRFRRMLREAHPDHGGTVDGAGDRIAELTEARRILLDLVASAPATAHG